MCGIKDGCKFFFPSHHWEMEITFPPLESALILLLSDSDKVTEVWWPFTALSLKKAWKLPILYSFLSRRQVHVCLPSYSDHMNRRYPEITWEGRKAQHPSVSMHMTPSQLLWLQGHENRARWELFKQDENFSVETSQLTELWEIIKWLYFKPLNFG